MYIYLTHFIGTGLNGKDELKGVYSVNDVEKAIQRFEMLYVCCPECTNPETEISLSKKGDEIKFVCAACGTKSRTKSAIERINKAI
jgi:translation initiation factor 2 beta subunit (eIF-2beta)/eIF-5